MWNFVRRAVRRNYGQDKEYYRIIDELFGFVPHNIELYKLALIHKSASLVLADGRQINNERLEFLGDAVLEIISSEFLYKEYPDKPEGELTKLRASIVCEPTLALCTKDIALGEYLLLGKGEDQTGGRGRKSILSDALEAVIGAIYLDGGFANAKEFIHKYILTDIEHKQLFYDSKTILQEVVQGEHEQLTYVLTDESGPDHNKSFTVRACIGERVIGSGTGHTKKAAEQEAAYQALLMLKNQQRG